MQGCGCFHPLYVDVDEARGDKSPCDLANETTEICINEVLAQLLNDDLPCSCNQSCYEIKYMPQISSTTWPSYQYAVGLKICI